MADPICPLLSKPLFDTLVSLPSINESCRTVYSNVECSAYLKIQKICDDSPPNNPITGAYYVWMSCLETGCVFWNAQKSVCSFNNQSIESVIGTAADAATFIPDTEDVPSTLINLLKHLNETHYDESGGSSVPKASTLLSEYFGGEDLDDNELIYGKDFKINATDVPKMLKALETDPTWPNPTTELSWQEYLDSIS